MDDEAITDLLVEARMAAPCAHAKARCEVQIECHRWYLDLIHSDRAAEPSRRVLSWRSLVETRREVQVAHLAVWLTRLHARANPHPDLAESNGGGGATYRAASDAGAPANAPSSDGIASGDRLGDGGIRDGALSSRTD